MIELNQPPTLLFFDRKGKQIDASKVFKQIDKPQHQAILAPSCAGMSFKLPKELDNE